MSARSWLRRVFKGTHDHGNTHHSEQDTPSDADLVSSRETGGKHRLHSGDQGSVTGTGETGEFVGQVAGDDLGYAEETGAEKRSQAGESNTA